MKATLEFDLPEDKHEMGLALAGGDLAYAIYDFDEVLRSRLKYHDISEAEAKIYEELRDKLREILDEHGCLDEVFS